MRRSMLLAVLVLSALTAGCTQAVAEAQGGACGDVRWGGWEGERRCTALAQRVIPGPARACRSDDECVLIHPDASCRDAAVSVSAVQDFRSQMASCVNPASGPCPPATVRCNDGCCEAH